MREGLPGCCIHINLKLILLVIVWLHKKHNTLNFFPFFASTTTTAAISAFFAYLFLNAAAWSAVPDYKRNKKET